MTFPEAMQGVIAGANARREIWKPRRMIGLAAAPWHPDQTAALLVMDREARGDYPPFPYTPTGEDVTANDWSVINDT